MWTQKAILQNIKDIFFHVSNKIRGSSYSKLDYLTSARTFTVNPGLAIIDHFEQLDPNLFLQKLIPDHTHFLSMKIFNEILFCKF